MNQESFILGTIKTRLELNLIVEILHFLISLRESLGEARLGISFKDSLCGDTDLIKTPINPHLSIILCNTST